MNDHCGFVRNAVPAIRWSHEHHRQRCPGVCVFFRDRYGRYLTTSGRFALPAGIAVGCLALVGAQGPVPLSHAAPAAQAAPAPPPATADAPAAPLPHPLLTVSPVSLAHRHERPPASAPVLRLPTDLHVTTTSIPRPVLAAYVNAARQTDRTDPRCELRWQVIAGIGFIESDHARSGGSADPHWDGIAKPPILGPLLDGQGGFAAIPDTDHGALDGSARWDRAVGPMQFLPSTWAVYAVDADGDGEANPEDINDSTLAAAHYLCAAASGLGTPQNLIRAVYAYNHSYDYVRAVLTATASYMSINPAKLGINKLPKPRPVRISLTVSAPPPPPPGSAPAHHRRASSSSPSASASPTPKPKPRPRPTPRPTVTLSPPSSSSPSPSPSPTSPVRTPLRSPAPSPSPSPSSSDTSATLPPP